MFIKAKLRITNLENTEQLLRLFLRDLNEKSTIVIKDGMVELKYFFSEEIPEELLETMAQHEVVEMSYEISVDSFGKSPKFINANRTRGFLASNNDESVFANNEQNENISVNRSVNEESLNLEKYITKIMREIGITADLLGYTYIRKAVILVINNKGLLNGFVKSVYPLIAQEFNTTPTRVERGIRHAVEVAWKRNSHRVNLALYGEEGTVISESPTNKRVVASIADRVKWDLNLG